MVKGTQFADYRDTGNPKTAAKVYNAQSVDELIFLDIEASEEGRHALIDVIESVSEEVFMPFCVGGGIQDKETIQTLLKAGADKVSICTAAVEDPKFIHDSVETFGSQCIVICIDFKKIDGQFIVHTHTGQKRTDWEVLDFVKHIMKYKPGELLLNSIDKDGTMDGYELEIIQKVVDCVDVPVIALGGAGKLSDFEDAFQAGVSAVAAASIFHFTDQSPIKANFYLKSNGIPVR